ncbi:hypothetical protein [Undibacterium terreum]|uniref:DUF2059 domain-containing protein n=1 Tax=Undibacterium terreum TaxID=1224302 RepID=A0A916XEC1_9BURK|nr:hypothetical protein [Undibacterium terreum]GGC65603.1 hypothetical protein GCM10011396_10770 [Undibacterium terreum]
MVSSKFLNFLAFSILAILSFGANADPSSRELTIRKIEELTFSRIGTFDPKSPQIEVFLKAAKTKNPEVDNETWESIRTDLTASLSQVVKANGGPMKGVFSGAMDNFSDEELEQLRKLLDDPIYKKLQTAMSNPAVQQRVINMTQGFAAIVWPVANKVLTKHGLKGVY